MPLVLFAVSIIIVGLMQTLSPTQRAISFVRSEQQAQPERIEAIIRQYNLDAPFHVQYGTWLREALQGNLGFSRTSSEPVMRTIRKRLPASAELAIYATIPIVIFGVWLGTITAIRRDSILDQVVRVLTVLGWSIPTFVFAIWLLAIAYGQFGLFGVGRVSNTFVLEIAQGEIRTPTRFMTIDAIINGRFDLLLDAWKHLVLPVTSLVVVICAQYVRVMRSAMLDALSQDYTRTAKAKGLPEKVVHLKHVRRNALIPVVTLAGFTAAGLLNGTVFVETIFNYEGIGQWLAASVVQFDIPAVIGFALVTGVIIVIANLIVDILYAVVDPRIRYN